MKRTVLLVISILAAFSGFAQSLPDPDATYLYAERDSCNLYMDVYEPSGQARASVIYVFGGGFFTGSRDSKEAREWFGKLTANGYRVISIDYRLGLKGYHGAGLNREFIEATRNAINLAVEDLFSATAFIIENSREIGIDPGLLIVSGSSAGAITAMQAEWDICNGDELADVLPEDFNYAGVISFSGALYNYEGGPVYAREPCPTLMFHGTADKIVPYDKVKLGKLYFGGSKSLATAYEKAGFNYNIYRFKDNDHGIAGSMMRNLDEELRFLEANVLHKERRIIDATVSDPVLKNSRTASGSFEDLYN